MIYNFVLIAEMGAMVCVDGVNSFTTLFVIAVMPVLLAAANICFGFGISLHVHAKNFGSCPPWYPRALFLSGLVLSIGIVAAVLALAHNFY